MADMLPEYQVYAIRYATRDARRREHFNFGEDLHDVAMPMDYFVWIAVNDGNTIMIDSGFTQETAAARGRTFLRCPIDSLKLIDLDADRIEKVILTHLHYDHVGNFHKFPHARFHLQEPEIHYAVGRHMRHPFLAAPYSLDDVLEVVRLSHGDRMRFHNGPAEIAPGITIHPVGGHTIGCQFVRIWTSRGWLVLASDVSHFYDNMELGHPFPAAFSNPDLVEAFDTLREAASSEDHIVPGHDPAVMRRYPAARPELEGIIARLDVPPLSASA